MTDETQLRRQIQEEMDREAKIDRMIEAKTKNFLKNKQTILSRFRKKRVRCYFIFS